MDELVGKTDSWMLNTSSSEKKYKESKGSKPAAHLWKVIESWKGDNHFLNKHFFSLSFQNRGEKWQNGGTEEAKKRKETKKEREVEGEEEGVKRGDQTSKN